MAVSISVLWMTTQAFQQCPPTACTGPPLGLFAVLLGNIRVVSFVAFPSVVWLLSVEQRKAGSVCSLFTESREILQNCREVNEGLDELWTQGCLTQRLLICMILFPQTGTPGLSEGTVTDAQL